MLKDNTIDIPEIFKGARDYVDDPSALEMAHATFNEKGLYKAISAFAVEWFKKAGRPAKVLDLCSATGLAASEVVKAIPVAAVTLVDIDSKAMKIAENHFTDMYNISYCCADAVTFKDTNQYDLILMNSAYHHIPEDKKIRFFQNSRSLLKDDGLILMGEHFLPDYSDEKEFKKKVIDFYTQMIRELETRREPVEAINVIRRSALYCWEGNYEYKVSWRVFQSHIDLSRLKISDGVTVWTYGDAHDYAGSIALVMSG